MGTIDGSWPSKAQPGAVMPMVSDTMRTIEMGDAKRIDNIFCLQRLQRDPHLFGYNFKRFEYALEKKGFKDIRKRELIDSHTGDKLDLRVECFKGDKP